MSHHKKELTAYQIAEAFPDECKEFIPKEIQELELKLIKKRAKLREIELSNHPQWIKTIAVMMAETISPREYQNRLEKYKKTLEVLKDLETKKYLDNTHKIAKAKAKPIDTFIVLEKQRMGTSRIHGKCPLGTHEDSKPSFVIYRATNTYHCFSCRESGDSIALFMNINKCTFNSALEELSR